jgi:hypothetical protein
VAERGAQVALVRRPEPVAQRQELLAERLMDKLPTCPVKHPAYHLVKRLDYPVKHPAFLVKPPAYLLYPRELSLRYSRLQQ